MFIASLVAAHATATGTLTVNGSVAHLTHVYAAEVAPMPGTTDREVRLVFSDAPLAGAALDPENPLPLSHLADARKVRAMTATIDAGRHIVNVSYFDPHFDVAPSGVTGSYRFEPQTFDETTIAGRLYTSAPRTFFKDTYAFDVTFSVPIARAAVQAAGAKAAAASSEQARVVLEYYQAARAGDLAALKRLLTPDSARELDGADRAQNLALLKAMATGTQTVDDVAVTGDTAVVTVTAVDGATTSKSRVSLAKVNGAWKVDASK